MTGKLLDVTTLPSEETYVCRDGSKINLKAVLKSHRDAIESLATVGLIRDNPSFGFAMVRPIHQHETLPDDFWDQPEQFVFFVGGWGPERERYIADAVRKLRPLLRLRDTDHEELFGLDTLDLRLGRHRDFFRDVVKSDNEDGSFPWGDFAKGGGVVVPLGEWALPGAVSGLTELQDDSVAKLILGVIAGLIILGDGLLPD